MIARVTMCPSIHKCRNAGWSKYLTVSCIVGEEQKRHMKLACVRGDVLLKLTEAWKEDRMPRE